jgi:hypothetical protein
MLLTCYRRNTYQRTSLVSSSFSEAEQLRGIASNIIAVSLGKAHHYRGHDIVIEKFVKSVLEDKQFPIPPEEGRETV